MADLTDALTGGYSPDQLAQDFYNERRDLTGNAGGGTNPDPVDLLTRWRRKAGAPEPIPIEPRAGPGGRGVAPAVPTIPKAAVPKQAEPDDLSRFGTEPTGEEEEHDLSKHGVPVEETTTPKTPGEPKRGAVAGATAVALESAVRGTGQIVQGAGVIGGQANNLIQPAVAGVLEPYYDAYEKWDQLTPDQRQETFQHIANDPHLPTAAKAEINQKLLAREQGQPAGTHDDFVGAKQPIQQNPAYKAGQAIQDVSKSLGVTPEEREQHWLAAGVGGAAPALVAGVAGGLVAGPPGAMAAGGLAFGSQAAGDTFEDALKKGATPETAAKAANLNALASGALGALPLGEVFAPFTKLTATVPGLAGVAARIAEKFAASGVTFASVGEVQEAITREIESHTYGPGYIERLQGEKDALNDKIKEAKRGPETVDRNAYIDKLEGRTKEIDGEIKDNKDYSPSERRIIANALTGGLLGGLFGITRPIRQQPPVTPPPPGTPASGRLGGGGGPPPTGGGAGAGPGAQPGGPGPGGGTPPPGAGARTGPEGQTDTWSYQTAGRPDPQGPSATGRKAELLRETLRYYGYPEDVLGRMSMDELRNELAYHDARTAKAKPSGEAAEPGGKTAPPPPKSPQRAYEDDTLRKYGFTDDQIAGMSDDERKTHLADAIKAGTPHGEPPPAAEPRPPEPPKPTETKPPVTGAEFDDMFDQAMEGEFGEPKGEFGEPKGDGTRESPVVGNTAEDVRTAEAQVEEPKSPEQAEAGNYKKGHITWNGMGLTIETPAGEMRRGVDEAGKAWAQRMPAAYGYLKNTKSAEYGEALDFYMGRHPNSPNVFVIDQRDPATGRFDEHKVMFGMTDARQAIETYLNAFDESGPDRFGGMTPMTLDQFKQWKDTTDLSRPVSKMLPAPKPRSSETGVVPTPQVEVTHEHIAAIEDALRQAGMRPEEVLPVDIHRAAEIHATEGLSPAAAFIKATVQDAYLQGALTEEQIHDVYEGGKDQDVDEAKGAEAAETQQAEAPAGGVRPGETGAPPERGEVAAPHGEPDRQGVAGEGGKPEGEQLQGGGKVEPTGKPGEAAEGAEPGAARPEAAEGGAGAERPEPTHGGERPPTGGPRGVEGERPVTTAEPEPAAGAAGEAKPPETTKPEGLHVTREQFQALAKRGRIHPSGEDTVKPSAAELAKAKTPVDYGRLYGYTEADIAHFYDKRRQGNELGYQEWLRDLADAAFPAGYKAKPLSEVVPVGQEPWRKSYGIVRDVSNVKPLAVVKVENIRAALGGNEVRGGEANVISRHKTWKQASKAAEQLYAKDLIAKKKAEREETAEAEKKPEKPSIEDVGEKIGGARKDLWAGRGLSDRELEAMNPAERAIHITKENVWPRPDYVAAVDVGGVEPRMAALLKVIYDRIPAKYQIPWGKDHTEAQNNYVKAVRAMRDALTEFKTVKDLEAAGARDSVFAKLGGKTDEAHDIMRALKKSREHYGPLDNLYSDKQKADDLVKRGFPNIEPWQRLYAIRQHDWNRKGEQWVVLRKNGGTVGRYATREDAEAAAKIAYEKAKTEKPVGGEEPKRPHLDQIQRTGPDYRKGKNVTGQDFIDDFGFRAVEFGNWVASDERQKVVNLAYDGLQDLARALNLPPKAISLDGKLAIAFGARGKGGKAAAHYEPSRIVINMTKLTGAGSLAHEWTHALDHYIGELEREGAYQGMPKEMSGGDVIPGPKTYDDYHSRLQNIKSVRLREAAARLMRTLYFKPEDLEQAVERLKKQVSRAQSGLDGWLRARERELKGGRRSGQTETQVKLWTRDLENAKAALEKVKTDFSLRKSVPTEYYEHAQKLSGSTGDYWKRPNEMLARSNEAYVFDKLAEAGHLSQYLVQGVEGTRFGNGFRGNPYPVGDERSRINRAFDRFYKQLAVIEGKHGAGTRIVGAEGPVEHNWVEQPSKEEQGAPLTDEQKAQDQANEEATEKSLPDSFMKYLRDEGNSFPNILQARKFAHELGFGDDPKKIEEALELGVVKLGREIVEHGDPPAETFAKLVNLYRRQPILGTRTSTSAREQAYSTPIPLAYVAAHLADITKETTVLEPTAGNGALLITADPKRVEANEINPDRHQNLRDQGFGEVENVDATQRDVFGKGYIERVIANPPFGVVTDDVTGQSKRFDLSDIQPGYETGEIDHVISLESLKAMADDGKAVLILGGVAKTAASQEARSGAYNSKSKREFYKVLYDNYNVTDHFTVSGDLYERQGAAWPVDVIKIDGRGKSDRRLPAVDVPRIYSSWDAIGGLLHEPGAGAEAGRPHGQAAQGVGGAAAGHGGGRTPTGPGGVRGGPKPGEPEGIQQRPVSGGQPEQPPGAGAGGRPGERGEPAGVGAEPAPIGRPPGVGDFDSAFEDALSNEFGPDEITGEPKPTEEPEQPTSAKVAQDAVKHGAEAADKAMEGLYQLFGGGKKATSGFTFDEETWKKAKPLFEQAASKFREFANDVRELVRRLVAELKRVWNFTKEQLESMRPYIQRFIQEVQQGIIKLGEREEKPPEEPTPPGARPQAEETAGQTKYEPQSKIDSMGTLVPSNMARAIQQSLSDLEARVGPLDKYVGKELGYSAAELGKYFKAEQIDAIAQAIDNFSRKKGSIIGDQTGIGKGRVNAAILRWAMKNKLAPIFVTEKPNLYGDMYRDLTDIGIQEMLGREPRIFTTNNGLDLPLDEEGKQKLKTGEPKVHSALMGSLSDPDLFRKKYDVVFTTYNQMQTLKGGETPRRNFLRALAPHSVMVFDESHNAGGQGQAKEEEGAAPNRAKFTRERIAENQGTFYSSATYAKRPDVMDLYAATDMSMAVEKIEDLAEAIARGGVPMQQVVASMLAEGGQYIRRERSFAGIDYNPKVVSVPHDTYDSVATAMSLIQDFSVAMKGGVKDIEDDIKGAAGAMGGDQAVGEAGVHSMNFTSIMHNVINQLLLSMKAKPAIDEAIVALQRGEKPVLTVANTMESFFKDYMTNMDLHVGDALEADFSDILMKYLERTRTIIIKKPFEKGPGERHYMTDEELGPAGLAAYNAAKNHIKNIDLSEFPVSPIDYIHNELKAKGYSVGEVTGRSLGLDYSGDKPKLKTRPGKELTPAGRRETISSFNNGKHDALILNQAGSTGISAHAGEKFKDQNQRHMMIVQPEANIDTHMQLLGRINRTGQVVLPRYTQMIADVPAEKRPAANLQKKMASLNANTTGARGGALTAKDVPDFLNDYGDMVAVAFVQDNPEMNAKLAFPVRMTETGWEREDAMRKLTGRIPLLPLKKQEAVYHELEEGYHDLLAQMEASGENNLEAKTLPLAAKTLDRTVVVGAKPGSHSPFAAPVTIERAEVNRLGKPLNPEEIKARILHELKVGDTDLKPEDVLAATDYRPYAREEGPGQKIYDAAKKDQDERNDQVKEKFDEYKREILDDIEKEDKREAQRVKLDAQHDRWRDLSNTLRVGNRVTLKMWNGNVLGIVLSVEQKGKPVNPTAMSTWKAHFATADASRLMTIPFSRLYPDGKSPKDDIAAIELGHRGYERPAESLENFARMQHEVHEKRFIATGNLLAAFDWLKHKGKITHFTDQNGNVRQGILTARGWDLGKHAKERGTLERDPAKVKAWLDEHKGQPISAGDISITKDRWSSVYELQADKAKRKGGKYYLDKELTKLTGDFYSRDKYMRVRFSPEEVDFNKVVSRIMALGGEFRLPAQLKTETVEEPQTKAQSITTPRRIEPTFTPEAQKRLPEIKAAIEDIINRMVGHHVEVDLVPGKTVARAVAPEWAQATEPGNVPEVVGQYTNYTDGRSLIEVALEHEGAVGVAHHEGWHAVENTLATPREKELLARETEGLKRAIKDDYKARDQKIDVDKMAPHEIRAEAYRIYAQARDEGEFGSGFGMHLGIRRFFEKVWKFLRAVANAIRRLGFQTTEDIFAKAYEGRMADRRRSTEPGWAEKSPAPQRAQALELPRQVSMDDRVDLYLRATTGRDGPFTAKERADAGNLLFNRMAREAGTAPVSTRAQAVSVPAVKIPARIGDSWKNYEHVTENVPISWLKNLPGNLLRQDINQPHGEYPTSLVEHIKATGGLEEPLIVHVGKESGTAMRGEGNHRLAALEQLGYTHAPVRAYIGREWGKGRPLSDVSQDLIPKKGEYFRSEAKPSDVFKSLADLKEKPPEAPPLPPKEGQALYAGLPFDRIAKAASKFWVNTFQPELYSERARTAEPLFGEYKSGTASGHDSISRFLEEMWRYWNAKDKKANLAFMHAIETGQMPNNPYEAGMYRILKDWLDRSWALEQRWGSQAGYFQDYFPHVWKRMDEARKWFDERLRSQQMGPTWFQKPRYYQTIQEGIAAGLELASNNVIDLVRHRLFSGVDLVNRMQLLYRLKDRGEAWNDYARGGAQLVDRGWQPIVAPDRKTWVISPDMQALWKNAVIAKGLWANEGPAGRTFRGWMIFKTAWVPVKLALSLYHPIHVYHINIANGLSQFVKVAVRNKDPLMALHRLAEGFYGPAQAALGPAAGHIGYRAMQAWDTPEQYRTPDQQWIVDLFKEGAVTPHMSEHMRISATHGVLKALAEIKRGEDLPSAIVRALYHGGRNFIEMIQSPFFEHWIPALKNAAYINAAAAFLQRNPHILHDPEQRRIGLRTIGKSMDDRFGEMFYGSLFWNRTLKDSLIGTMISLGWNTGQVRQVGGAALEAVGRPAMRITTAVANRMGVKPPGILEDTQSRRTIADASDKLGFVVAYIASVIAANSIMTWWNTGDNIFKQTPLDWFYARMGYKNPDGTNARVANPYWLKEAFTFKKHLEEFGGDIVPALGKTAYNKFLVAPFLDIINNKDFYGREIWDEKSNYLERTWQTMKHEWRETRPISVTGAERTKERGGSETEMIMAFLGFGPAPGYIERTPIENRISHLYDIHARPNAKPYDEEAAVNRPSWNAVRAKILMGTRDNNQKMVDEAYAEGRSLGMTNQYMARVRRGEPMAHALFKRLEVPDQMEILHRAKGTPEFDVYRRLSSDKTKKALRQEQAAPPQLSTTTL